MFSSYRDALVFGKAVEQPPKPTLTPTKVYKTFHTSDIKKMCGKGNLSDLKLVNPKYFTQDSIDILNSFMKDKINEIEIWKYEEQNQYQDILDDFEERIQNIKSCIDYVNSFIKKE